MKYEVCQKVGEASAPSVKSYLWWSHWRILPLTAAQQGLPLCPDKAWDFWWKLFLVLNSLFICIVFPLTSVSQNALDSSSLLSPQSYMRNYLNFDGSGQSSAFLSLSAVWLLEAHVRLNPDYPAQSRATVLEEAGHLMHSTHPNFSTSPDFLY